VVVLDSRIKGRKLHWERAIWLIDLTAYLLVCIAGLFAAFDSSVYVVSVVQVPWVIWLWGSLLVGGGLFAFIGRLTRVWALEFFANVWAAAGAVLYAIILVPAVASGSSVAVFALVLVAWLFMLRRYAELKIFTSEPGLDTFRKRLDRALRLRTRNVVDRERF
jgi:hypothetical protein